MALIRWGREGDIFSELSRMQQEMSRLFSSFTSNWPGHTSTTGYKAAVYPPLNIYYDGETYIVRAEIPGVDPKSVDIEVTGDTLTLRGERKLPDLPAGSSYHRRERDFGEFRRSFTLPDRVDNNKVMAMCQDGVLEIRLPPSEAAKARRITVKAS